MSTSLTTRPPPLSLRQLKGASQEFKGCPLVSSPEQSGLSPNLQPATPPIFGPDEPFVPSCIGDYVILNPTEASNLYKCLNTREPQKQLVCKVVGIDKVRDCLSGHLRLEGHPNVNRVEEVLMGSSRAYLFFEGSHGDLHSWVRQQRRLQEREARHLFAQVVSAVAACHSAHIVLRDLKLSKFVFKDPHRTELKLESLDDGVVLEDADGSNDRLSDKHGCPVYVSPEILSPSGLPYSGKAADCWSLGVMLYTMLLGRYPFHDSDPSVLFSKIRRGQYNLPDCLSSKAKCLIGNLLRKDPNQRLTAEEILDHPWFGKGGPDGRSSIVAPRETLRPHNNQGLRRLQDEAKVPDQTVPDMANTDEQSSSMFT